MNENTLKSLALLRQLNGKASGSMGLGVGALNELLLQVVLALLMIFMIAYFLFVDQKKKELAEEVLALNRQKLTVALEQVAEEHRVRYGLNALMTQGTDGRRTFSAADFVQGGRLELVPAAKAAFVGGSRAAKADYADSEALRSSWREAAFAAAELKPEELPADDQVWFEGEIETRIEALRLDARGVQRALAARLLRQWVEQPELFGVEVEDPSRLVDTLKVKSLQLLEREIGGEVLP